MHLSFASRCTSVTKAMRRARRGPPRERTRCPGRAKADPAASAAAPANRPLLETPSPIAIYDPTIRWERVSHYCGFEVSFRTFLQLIAVLARGQVAYFFPAPRGT